MIVTAATPQPSLKANQAALDVEQNGSSSQGPPAYGSYGSYSYPARIRSGQSPARRFFEAFVVAIIIYALFGMLTGSMVWVSHDGRHHRGWYAQDWPSDSSEQGWPLPSDGEAYTCVSGSGWTASQAVREYPYTSYTEFQLPLDSDVLYLLARGRLASGAVEVVDWEDGQDKVKIEVVASYYTPTALDRASVCEVSRKDGEHGVGIFTPHDWRHVNREDQIHFGVTVHIPLSSARVRAFETYMPLFRHMFRTSERLTFDSLSVHGSNMPIDASSLQAEHATLKTSNGPITGVFNTSSSLELQTSNAPIKAAVGLTNAPSGASTTLVMKTSNGPIDSSLSLLSSEHTKGSYNVNTETSNNVLKVQYDAAPLEHTLVHHARTSNGPATVSLHRAYEGEFSLRSSNISPSVVESEKNAEDPAGQGRRRWLSIYKVKNVLTGGVYWGGEKKGEKGNVDVQTSNSPARLVLL